MMKYLFIVILVQFLSSCTFSRAFSLNELIGRADLDGTRTTDLQLKSIKTPLLGPVRTNPITTDIWVHPYELPNGDYFRGAWIRTIIQHSSWKFQEGTNLVVPKAKKSRRHSPRRHRKRGK